MPSEPFEGESFMALTRFCAMALLLAAPMALQAQFRGPPGGFGGSFGGGFYSDPARTFEFLARGRPFFLISETRSLREPLTQYAKEKGITNDQITKEHFVAFSEQMKAKMSAPASSSAPSPGKVSPSPTPSATGSPPASMGAPSATPSPDFMAQMADNDFKRRDRNGDGKLSTDEMSDTLRSNLDQFDKNKDNMVDFEEYKGYFAFRMLNRDGDRGSSNNNSSSRSPEPINPVAILIMEDYDVKPVVIRAGKLPKELPKWFNELDADADGQVAMYEWRKGGKNLDEFMEWDRNEDGFVTPEEVLRKLNLASSDPGASPSASKGASSSTSSGNGGPPRFGGFGGFGGGERPSFGGGPPGSSGSGSGGRPPFGGFGGFGKKKGSN
jgi:hypothetical protein